MSSRAADGTVRQGWSALLEGLDEFADKPTCCRPTRSGPAAGGRQRHLHPEPGVSDLDCRRTQRPWSRGSCDRTGLAEPQPWRLDPLPLILDDREWASLEAGLVQRAELLDAILADLYGARRLLSRRLIPASAIFDHDEYLRPLVGSQALASPATVS